VGINVEVHTKRRKRERERQGQGEVCVHTTEPSLRPSESSPFLDFRDSLTLASRNAHDSGLRLGCVGGNRVPSVRPGVEGWFPNASKWFQSLLIILPIAIIM